MARFTLRDDEFILATAAPSRNVPVREWLADVETVVSVQNKAIVENCRNAIINDPEYQRIRPNQHNLIMVAGQSTTSLELFPYGNNYIFDARFGISRVQNNHFEQLSLMGAEVLLEHTDTYDPSYDTELRMKPTKRKKQTHSLEFLPHTLAHSVYDPDYVPSRKVRNLQLRYFSCIISLEPPSTDREMFGFQPFARFDSFIAGNEVTLHKIWICKFPKIRLQFSKEARAHWDLSLVNDKPGGEALREFAVSQRRKIEAQTDEKIRKHNDVYDAKISKLKDQLQKLEEQRRVGLRLLRDEKARRVANVGGIKS